MTPPQSQDIEHQEAAGWCFSGSKEEEAQTGEGPRKTDGGGDGWEHVLPAKS